MDIRNAINITLAMCENCRVVMLKDIAKSKNSISDYCPEDMTGKLCDECFRKLYLTKDESFRIVSVDALMGIRSNADHSRRLLEFHHDCKHITPYLIDIVSAIDKIDLESWAQKEF